jgi:acyl-CoA synthetase (AMP-forming)/AMP-acid ligase II
MTEITTVLGMTPAEGFSNAGSTGRPAPNVEVRLVDDDGNDVPQGENSTGELWARAPNVMKVCG